MVILGPNFVIVCDNKFDNNYNLVTIAHGARSQDSKVTGSFMLEQVKGCFWAQLIT